MTGAGSATAAFTVESDFGAGPATEPTWYQPGIDITVTELTVEQALERSRHPDDPTPAGSREGNWEGALSVSFTITDSNFHDLVFADGGTALPHQVTQAPSSTWYADVQLPDGTVESRTPVGTIVIDAVINYEQGGAITAELTMLYADEPSDITEPTSITQPAESDAFTWHGASFTVDGLNQPLMQSASLSLSNLHRFRRGQERHPYDAVTGAIEPSFETDAIFTERDQLTMAVDDTAGTDDGLGKVSGSFSISNGQGTTIEYSLTGLQPQSYSWSDLIAPDSDLTEPITYHVTDVEVI